MFQDLNPIWSYHNETIKVSLVFYTLTFHGMNNPMNKNVITDFIYTNTHTYTYISTYILFRYIYTYISTYTAFRSAMPNADLDSQGCIYIIQVHIYLYIYIYIIQVHIMRPLLHNIPKENIRK